MYVPLSGLEGHSSTSVDIMILTIHIIGISSLMGGINLICTIENIRHYNMSWVEMGIFSWSILVTSILLVLSIPILGVGVTLLLLDRNMNTSLYNTEGGGNNLLYQHLF
jgi:heme/copper-type cytochrome/quinol oxidase subunit 1